MIDLIIVDEMNGSADCLRAVSDRIRGDFICLHSDFISQYSLGRLATMHKLSCSDITMMLIVASKDMKRDEVDDEFLGICDNGRIVMKLSKLEVGENIVFPKALLHRAPTLALRQDLIDVGIYFMSHWIIELLIDNKKITSIKSDLLPYLIQRQFLPSQYIMKLLPSLQHRHRPLQGLESWIVHNNNGNYSRNHHSSRDNSNDDKNKLLYDSLFINHNRHLNNNSNNHDDTQSKNSSNNSYSWDHDSSADDDSDILRCFGMVYDHIQYSNNMNLFGVINDDLVSVSNNSTASSTTSAGGGGSNITSMTQGMQPVSSIMLNRLVNIPIYLQMNR